MNKVSEAKKWVVMSFISISRLLELPLYHFAIPNFGKL